MSKQKPGPWFPEAIKPVHVGVYEVDESDADGRSFSYWDGKRWGYVGWVNLSGGTVKKAIRAAAQQAEDGSFRSCMFGWRGLDQPPVA